MRRHSRMRERVSVLVFALIVLVTIVGLSITAQRARKPVIAESEPALA